jgi:hypothetical protein
LILITALRTLTMIKTLIKAIMITACATATTAVAAGQAAPIPPKQRIEREFRLLETALARCMYEEVIPSPDMEFMNRALFEFMRDNPGITRILRVNAGGFTVNDVTAESPRSAPPRSVSGQRWFQHISQGKAPYYSMEVAADGQISLFYAWPLTINSGLEMTVTGGFAASIDLVSQIALIDDAPPFRILYAGKAIFEHDWEGLDYDEEPLPVKGVKDMTIQTLKPMLTRLDPRAPSKSKPGGAQSAQKRSADIGDDTDDEDYEDDAAIPGKKKKNAESGRTNKILVALLILITLMLVYSMFSEKISRAVRAWNDTRSMKAIGRTTTASMPIVTSETLPTPTTTTMPIITAATQPPQTQQPPMLPPQPIVTKIISNERAEKAEKLFKEQQKTIAKMAELIRKKIDVMEGKIETLSKKLEVLEKDRSK